ncbi:MAG: energy-coupling factor transporter transmembrane protein EcfT [Bacilli bacterium]|nr:energy-coupling factor transporter transmembrane protein EcfT [Bacilli bacterium]
MNFSLGRYIPYESIIHKIDPRAKIVGIIALMVCIFLPMRSWTMTATSLGLSTILVIILLACTRTGIHNILGSLKSMWFMVIMLLLVYTLMPYNSLPNIPVDDNLGVAWNLNGWTVYWGSFAAAGTILMRLVLMISITVVLTASTKPLDLTYAFEWYLTPLKVIHFPAHEVAMTISIALRFIPTLMDDTKRIMKAQESRGVDFSHGGLGKKIRALSSLIVPLFVSAFSRSEELANAMECRGYDPKAKRTRYRILRWKWFDWVFLILLLAILALYIYVCVSGFDPYNFFFGLTLQ